jgi:hypothetical protein
MAKQAKKKRVRVNETIIISVVNSAAGSYLSYSVSGQAFGGDVVLHPGEQIRYSCAHSFILYIKGFTPIFVPGHGVENPGNGPHTPFDGFVFQSDSKNELPLRATGGGGGGPRPLRGSYKYGVTVETPNGPVRDDPQIIVE